MAALRVRDAMKIITSPSIIVREEASIYETVRLMIDTPHARLASVVDEQGRLVGIVTLKSLVDHIFAHRHFENRKTLGSMFNIVHTENSLDLATPQVIYVTPDESLEEAVQKMQAVGLEEIPVVDEEGIVIGDINLLDLLSIWIESSLEARQKEGHERVRLSRHTNKDLIVVGLRSRKKEGALEELFEVLAKAPQITDLEEFRRVVKSREGMVTTGVGRGVAIPHGRSSCVRDCVLAIGISDKGVDFASLDGKPVHLIFLIAAPETAGFPYAQLLSRVMRLLYVPESRRRLLSCKKPEQVYAVLSEYDRIEESQRAFAKV